MFLLLFLGTVIVAGEGLTVDNGSNITIRSGFPGSIKFSYYNGTNMTSTIIIYVKNDIIIDGTISETNRTGEVLILPEDLTNITYGSYLLTLTLRGSPNTIEAKDMIMFYEEAITGLMAKTNPVHVLVNQEVKVEITLLTGSNVDTEWRIDNNKVFTRKCSGVARKIDISVTFDVVQMYNVKVFAKNTVSGPESIQMQVEVVRPVQGFDVDYRNETVLTKNDGPVLFVLSLDTLDRMPMGDLTFELAYDNVTVLVVDLENHTDSLVNDGVGISYKHMVQGNFIVDASVTSQLDSQHFIFNLSIWENITFPSIKSLAATNANIFMTNYSLDSQIFEYSIDYGNGDVEQNGPDILQTGRQSQWYYSYYVTGTYIISITASNPVYSYSDVRTIIIIYPIPALSIHPPLTTNTNYFPSIQNGAVFTISMVSNNSSPTDMFCVFLFENGVSPLNVSVVITFAVPFTKTHTYTTSGEKEVSVVCTNPTSNQSLSTKVHILPAIEGFQLIGQNQMYISDISSTIHKTFEFGYTVGHEMNATATIYADPLIPLNVDFNTNQKRGSVIVSSEKLTNLSYGTYRIAIKLWSMSGEVQYRAIALFYEESLDGFEVLQHDNLRLIQTDTEFEAKFTNGSNPQMELLFEGTDSIVEKGIGMIRQMTFDYVFSTPLIYNVTSVARNSLGKKTITNLRVEVVRSVKGFSVEMKSSLINSYSNMTFTIRLDNSDRLPMGTMQLFVDFGDGSLLNMTVNDKYDAFLSSEGYPVLHYYTTQGNRDVVMQFKAELSQQKIQLTAKIWDDITLVKLNSDWAVKVDEIIPFNFINARSSGFEYNITYGDGGQVVNAQNVLYNKFNEATKYHSYNKPGIYQVKLNASNPYYNIVYQYRMAVQYPIPALQISPQPPYMIPIPNGIIIFTITMVTKNETPTNVTCMFKYEESHSGVNETIVFEYDVSITRQYPYTTGGKKNVNITCVNFVSSNILLTVIDAQPVVLDDYTFEYQHIVPASMTSDSEYIPVVVNFIVHLFESVRFSPNVSLLWDFKDGTSNDMTDGKHHSHEYIRRGHYNITVKIKDGHTSVTKILPIKIGAVDFKLDTYVGYVANSKFKYTISGIGISGTYTLVVSAKETIHHTQLDVSDVYVHEHTYLYYIKKYRPKIIAQNANFTEILYFDIIKVDFNLTILKIVMTKKTRFPPGEVTVRVFLEDSKSTTLPFVTCYYDMGDYIDYQIYQKNQNITFHEPLIFHYKYKVLGNLTATVTCANNYDTFRNQTVVESYNECFTVNGIFDRQYSNKSHPMMVYTSSDFDLASRMAVYCNNVQIEFNWEIYTFDDQNNTHLYNYTPIVLPRGIFRVGKGSLPEDLYRVALNVSLLGKTWIWEPIHIQFVKPPPYSYIEGGNERYAKILKKHLTLDALTGSYDVSFGYGGNENLSFVWSCKLIQANNLTELSQHLKDGIDGNEDCAHLLPEQSRGVAVLNLLEDDKQGYVVNVTVVLANTLYPLSNSFVQLIMGTYTTAPNVVIKCTFNCDKKYSTMSKSIWKAMCLDCEDDAGSLEYRWTLNRVDSTLVVENNLRDMVNTDIDKEVLVILEDKLRVNSKYELKVSVNRLGEEEKEDITISLYTKVSPYGGSCTVSNRSATGRAVEILDKETYAIPSGIASATLFAVHCHHWKDDIDQEDVADTNKKVPLIYEYLLVQNHTDENNNTVTESTSIYKGGESSASELRLPAGEKEYNYIVDIHVNIFNRFGDYTTVRLSVQVNPNLVYTLENDGDTETTTKMLENFDNNFGKTEAGGNDIAVFRLMISTASFYNKIKFKNSTMKSDTTSLAGIVSYGDTPQSEVQNKLQQRTTDFVNIISRKVPENSSLVILPANSRLIAKTLDACISNVDVMSENTSTEVSIAAYNLIQNVQKVSNLNPFPMTEFKNIQEATTDVLSVLSGNVEFLSMSSQEDLNKTLTRTLVTDELQEYYRYHPEGIEGFTYITDQLIELTFEKRKKIRQRQENFADSTKASLDKLMSALDLAVNITSTTTASGEGEKTIKQKNLNVSIEKDSTETFLNRSEIKRDGFSLDMTNGTLDNITATEMEIQVSVFRKSPILHAGGNSKIKGRIIGISFRDEKKEKVEVPLTMKIQNEGVAFTSEYAASTDEEMEFISQLQDHNDAVLVYINPKGFDEDNIDKYNYTVYVNSKTSPTIKEYDFKKVLSAQDWTSFGFKVFVPSGTLEEGNIIISLNVIEDSDDAMTEKVRRRRSTDALNNTESNTLLTNLSISIVTTGCRAFDSKSQSWHPNGCSVLSFSTLNETVCRCPPGSGTFFASSFVTPNLIDFNTVFSKFDASNAAVYGTMIGIIFLYILGVIYLRRKDKTDNIKWIPYFLCDNKGGDDYFYMVSVHTGLRPSSGTKSSVCFIVAGDARDTGARILSDGTTKGCVTGSVCTYIMSTAECLGDLQYIRIWHDNSGEGNDCSWYLHKIVVRDLQTEECFIFFCDDWLALDIGDGNIDRIIAAMSKNSIEFETLLSQHARLNMTENHLWLSLLLRPQKSSFTRVQRLSCILVLLFLAMITNAMFFQTEDEETVTADTVRLGAFRLSLRAVYISVVGAVITIIPLFLITFLFRNSRAKKTIDKTSKNDSDNNDVVEYNSPDIRLVETGKLPHWVIYIAWTIVTLAVVASAFFLLLYSMQWGTEISNEWLTTFVLSFLESILVVDPVKVLLFAILIAVVTRRPVEGEEVIVDLDSVKQSSKQMATNDNFNDFTEMKMAVHSVGKELPAAALRKKRRQIYKEKTAKRAFINLMLQVLFAMLVFSISYMNRDERAYLLKANIENQLYISSKYQFGFSKVTSQEGFMTWIKDTLLPAYFPTSSYSGGSISIRDKFFIADMANVRLGLIRMRQLRVRKEACYGSSIQHGHSCGPKYDSDSESKETFCQDCSITWTPGAWQYTSAKDIWGVTLVGKYNTYGGGGYIMALENEKLRTEKMIDESVANRWIDRLTRAVLVEFTLYNANINMMAYSIFMVEFSEVGGAFTWYDTQCFRPTQVTDATGVFSIICYIFFMIIIIIVTMKWIQQMKEGKCHAFKQFWNIIDFILCLCGYVAIVVWICKYVITKQALQIYYNDKSRFVNFQHIIVWEYIYNCILGILCFVSTIRLLRALGYNKRLTEIATVLKVGGVQIFQFFVLFFYFFIAFVLLGFLLFGQVVYEWRNLLVSFGSLTNTLIGRTSLDKMIKAAPNFAEIYFFIYVFFVIFTLMTMFLSILNKAIADVRQSHNPHEQTFGISNIMKSSVNDMLQLFGIHIGRKRKSNKSTSKNQRPSATPRVNAPNVMRLVREMLGDIATTSEDFQDMSQDHKYRENTKHVQKQETRFPEVTFTSAFSDINNQIDTSEPPHFTRDNTRVSFLTDVPRASCLGYTDTLQASLTPHKICVVLSEEQKQDKDDCYEMFQPYL